MCILITSWFYSRIPCQLRQRLPIVAPGKREVSHCETSSKMSKSWHRSYSYLRTPPSSACPTLRSAYLQARATVTPSCSVFLSIPGKERPQEGAAAADGVWGAEGQLRPSVAFSCSVKLHEDTKRATKRDPAVLWLCVGCDPSKEVGGWIGSCAGGSIGLLLGYIGRRETGSSEGEG